MAELENRYVVIKLSKLSTTQKSELHSYIMHEHDVPAASLVHCVVVEKDWPMYDATVKSVLDYAEQNEKQKSCKYCKGTGGQLIAEGHDYWGNTDNTYGTCPVCKGNGYHNEKRYQLVLERDSLNNQLEQQ